jgi:acetyltransferase-like isoleucine patch superfamily enzyme
MSDTPLKKMGTLRAEILYQLRYGLPLWLFQLLTAWLPDAGPFVRLRGALVALVLPGRPRRLMLGRDVTLLSVHNLYIGRSVYLAKGTWINAVGGLTIEDEVFTAPYVVIATSKHGFREGSVAEGGAHPAPVRIGRGTWLAAHAVVTAGVDVGAGNLIAANAVVVATTPENVIVGGVPGRVLGPRTDDPSEILSKHDAR